MTNIKQLIMTLVALLAVTTGAWAQTETLLTTITATAKEQASYSTANVATVSFSTTANGSSAYLANWGWWGYGWIATVTAAEGYTITKCIFYDDANRTATDSESPFVVETTEEDKTPRINGTPIDGGNQWSKGIMKIEVYGYVTPTAPAGTALTPDATRKVWTLDKMPANDIELQVEYYPGMLTLAPTAADKKGGTLELVVTPMTEITTDNVPAGWSGKFSASADDLPADFVAMTQDEAVALGAPTSGFSLVIFAVENEEFKVLTWENGVMQGVQKKNCYNMYSLINNDNIQSFYTVASSTGATGLPAGFEQDDKGNIYVEKDTKFKVKAVPAEGYHLVSLSDGTNTYKVDADGIATITMPEGDADLTLTAQFSDAYDIAFQAANANTIEAGKATVTVGGTAATVTDGKLQGVKMGSEVKVKAATGYKFRKVEVKKGGGEPVLLTTITAADNSSFKSGSQTFGDVATVTLTGDYLTNDGSHGGWYCLGSNKTATISVAEANGANITSVKFYTAGGGSAEDKDAPFEVTTTSVTSSNITTYLNGNSIGSYGVSKIEVYGTK